MERTRLRELTQIPRILVLNNDFLVEMERTRLRELTHSESKFGKDHFR